LLYCLSLVAMALSLTAGMGHDVFVPATYVIVLFSILVQGLTIGKFAKRMSA
jgi:CPA1 family monovalent cation:H+ antiporter